jgi:micrococcal nuclease
MTSDGVTWRFPMRSCRVYDADTLMDVELDLGFGVSIVITARLFGINAPEVRGKEKLRGVAAREWLQARLDIAKNVLVETRPAGEKPVGKYGRWLVVIWADDENLNDALVDEGHAVRADY